MAGYRLGVDLGTTWTAAAVVSGGGPPTVVSLSQRSPAIPSVVHIAANGAVLVGEAAERRALDEPERVAREMKRRIGDPTPIVLGGSPWAAELLQARVLRAVVDQVTAEQGGPPDSICVTHPANWGAFKLDLLTQAIRQVGVAAVDLLPEPVAAASWYASGHRLDDGATIAVYDLGGGTFDTAVVRRVGAGFQLLGRPDGIERFGGIDIDAAVLSHVAAELGDAWATLDLRDPEALADAAELRQRCVEAKEALSVDTAASIPVRLPGVRTTVRLTRDELESMVRGPLGETIVALRRTITSAGLTPSDLSAVLLVGGSSRIPLVAHLVSGELGVPVAVDANPKYAVALGAALTPASAGAPVAAPVEPVAPTPPPAPAPVASIPASSGPPEAAAVPPAGPPQAPDGPAMPVPEPASAGGGRPRWLVPAGIVAVIVVIAGVLLATKGGGGDDGATTASGDQPTTTASGSDSTDDTSGGTGGANTDGELRIGIVLPPDSDVVAVPMRTAAQIAVDDVNGAGGFNGTDVTLIAESSDDTPEGAVAAYDRVRDQGADFVIAPPHIGNLSAVASAAAGEQVPGCAAVDIGIDEIAPSDGWFVRTIANQELEAKALATAISDDGHDTVAIAAPSSLGYHQQLLDALDDAGIAVALDYAYEDDQLDVEDAVNQLNDTGADAFVLVGSNDLSQVIADGERSGLTGPWYGDDSLEFDDVGPRIHDALVSRGPDLQVNTVTIDEVPGFAEPDTLASRVAHQMGNDGAYPYFAPYVYDCVLLGATAAVRAASDAPEDIRHNLIDVSREGQACDGAECIGLAAEADDVDYRGATGVDLDDDGEAHGGLFARQHWSADDGLVFDSPMDVVRGG